MDSQQIEVPQVCFIQLYYAKLHHTTVLMSQCCSSPFHDPSNRCIRLVDARRLRVFLLINARRLPVFLWFRMGVHVLPIDAGRQLGVPPSERRCDM